jgi:hypothetical protein
VWECKPCPSQSGAGNPFLLVSVGFVVGCGLLSEVSIFVTNPPSLILVFCVVFEDGDVAVLGILCCV